MNGELKIHNKGDFAEEVVKVKKAEQLIAKIEDPQLALEVRQLMGELIEAAFTDPLTDLYNRRFFEYKLQQVLELSKEKQQQFSVLFLDLDNFKAVNDRLGHAYGDHVLKHVSALMSDNLRAQDLIARWGGEEFAAILPETNTQHAIIVAERIRKAIADHSFYDQILTVSCGIASYPNHGQDAVSLLTLADHAMYYAKAASKNKVTVAGQYQFKSKEKAALGYLPQRTIPGSIWTKDNFFLVKSWKQLGEESSFVLAQTDRGPVYLQKNDHLWFLLNELS